MKVKIVDNVTPNFMLRDIKPCFYYALYIYIEAICVHCNYFFTTVTDEFMLVAATIGLGKEYYFTDHRELGRQCWPKL